MDNDSWVQKCREIVVEGHRGRLWTTTVGYRSVGRL